MQYFCWVFCQLGFALDNLATEASLIPQAFEWSDPLTSLTRIQLLDQTPTQLANIAATCPPPHDGLLLLRIAPWYTTAGLLLSLASLWAAFWLPVFYWVLSSCCGCLYRCSCYFCQRRRANGRYSTPPRAKRLPTTNWARRAQQLRALVSTTKPVEEEEEDTPEEERRTPGTAFCVRSRKASSRERARDARDGSPEPSAPPSGDYQFLRTALVGRDIQRTAGWNSSTPGVLACARDTLRATNSNWWEAGNPLGRTTGGSGKAPGFAAEHADEGTGSHRVYYDCSCQTFAEASRHQKLVDAYTRSTENIVVSFTLNNKGGWSRTVVGSSAGKGGSLTPGSTLTQEQLFECLDFVLEAAEARLRHNAMYDAAGLQILLPEGAPVGIDQEVPSSGVFPRL